MKPGISLTASQEEFYTKFLRFIENDNDNVFILKGYAGTGKTFMINVIIQFLETKRRTYRLMAPTGRAAKVIADKTGKSAYTIHKSIYSFEKFEIKKGKKSSFTYNYKVRNNDDKEDAIYIVDEASMISSQYSEAGIFNFGSGKLLSDLFLFIHQNKLFPRRKILFVGDSAQLPPVNTNLSPALDCEAIEGFGFNTLEHTFEEIVRQKEGSGIIKQTNHIREMLFNNDYGDFFFKERLHDVKHISHEEFLEEYLSVADFRNESDSIVITYSNRMALYYNKWIRSHFFPESPTLSPGDRVMVTTNNYSYSIELLNGDFGTIIDVSDEVEIPDQPVYVDTLFGEVANSPALKKVNLSFRDCVIRFTDPAGNPHDIVCKIFDNLLLSDKREITEEERKGLMVHFDKRHEKLEPGTDEYIETLKTDEYVNALRLKFGYAITGHKSQGGEWTNVFVDIKRPLKVSDEAYFRWLYTTFSRCKTSLYVVREYREENEDPYYSYDFE